MALLELRMSIPVWVPMPYKTVEESVIRNEHFAPENVYLVARIGLIPFPSDPTFSDIHPRFTTRDFHDETMTGPSPEVQVFIELLRANGATPACGTAGILGRDMSAADFVFWFDVSSDASKAYYKVETRQGCREITVSIRCRKFDPIVIGNMVFIDEILDAIMTLCRDPVEACARYLKKTR